MIRKHQNKIGGIRGAKPRFSSAKAGNGERSKAEDEYLEIRNQGQRAKAMTAEMELAQKRGELVEKRLVERQAAFLLIAMRQKILNLPTTYARRMVGLKDASQAKKMLQEMAISVLNEIKDLPQQVTNPDWLRELEADGGK